MFSFLSHPGIGLVVFFSVCLFFVAWPTRLWSPDIYLLNINCKSEIDAIGLHFSLKCDKDRTSLALYPVLACHDI